MTRRATPLLPLLVALSTACVSSGADVHLAPFWTRLSTAGGGRETEAAFGFWISEEPADPEASERFGLRPFWTRSIRPDGDVVTYYLAPLGFGRRSGDHLAHWLLPLFVWQSREDREGRLEWELLALPGFLFTHNQRGREKLGLSLLWGDAREFLTFDRVRWLLFPLYAITEREGKTSHHLLFPVVSWSHGGGLHAWRFWPFYGRSHLEGEYDRSFVLWPIVHWHENGLSREPEERERKWAVLPFFGRTARGSYRSTTVLWPFFGWASDPETGFWAWDGPWPLVRLQGGGEDPLAEARTRVWPFYSHFQASGLRAWSVLWPLIHHRIEEYPWARRRGTWVVPFWQRWVRVDKETGERSSWTKLWPIAQVETAGGARDWSFPSLSPFQRSEWLDFHHGWLWQLWRRRTDADREIVRERSWGGLWRREKDAGEDRRSLACLWARRDFRHEGREARETSLLFGLVRWRTIEGEGVDLLAPALPGPGFPAARSPAPRPSEPSPDR